MSIEYRTVANYYFIYNNQHCFSSTIKCKLNSQNDSLWMGTLTSSHRAYAVIFFLQAALTVRHSPSLLLDRR